MHAPVQGHFFFLGWSLPGAATRIQDLKSLGNF